MAEAIGEGNDGHGKTRKKNRRQEEIDLAGKSFRANFHHLPFIEDNVLIINGSINGGGNL